MFISAALLCIASLASAQLTYRLDGNSNSYTLQTPNSQTHFTQYFNGQGAGGAEDGQNLARYQQAQNQQQVCSQRFYFRKYALKEIYLFAFVIISFNRFIIFVFAIEIK